MRKIIAVFALLLMTGMASADKVNVMEALKKAEALMPGQKFEMKKYSTSPDSKADNNPFYIFNVRGGEGYVLVSADDRTEAILGYSTSGNIELDDMPDNLRYWLDFYAAEIKAIEGGKAKGSQLKSQPSRANIEPLITAKWNQALPYNLMCPDGSGIDWDADGYDPSNRCVTGCVATAVAQVMYYHQWPKTTADIPSYKTKINGTTFKPSVLPATTLEWDKMKDTYTKNETGDEAWAVARLMRYVGQAFKTYYNIAKNGGSGTYIYNNMLVDCFNYSKQIHTMYRDDYTTTQWEDMVYDELANNRPVPYGGFSDDGSGHQFVCDGYKDGLFHLNWGWGGKLDGFFVLSIADPDGEQGVGGSTGAFKRMQDAVFKMMPAGENEEEVPVFKSVVETSFETTDYDRKAASEDFKDVSIPTKFEVWYDYIPTTTYNAEIGWGLYQNDQLVECVGSLAFTVDNQELKLGNYRVITYTMTTSFGTDLPDGRYQLRQIFRKAGSNDAWTLMDSYGTNYLVADISGNTLTLRCAVAIKPTMNDVVMMISFILGENPANFDEMASDMNGDGKITVADVIQALDKILKAE